MRKDRFLLIKFFLSLLILFSFSTIVKAVDHQILIITPVKYERIARQFLDLHDSDIFSLTPTVQLRGCYALVEEIAGSYSGTDQPSAAGNPPCPTLTEEKTGIDYVNEISPKIIKFLRGALLFQTELNDIGNWGNSRDYAVNLLHDKNGGRGLSWQDAKFDYLLLLGETGAPGPGAVTLNGVPESWYVYMDDRQYNQSPDADNTWFPTDFFYASPDYEAPNQDTPLWQDLWIPNLRVGRIPIYDNDFLDTGIVTELNTIDEADLYNTWGVLDECDVCDSQRAVGGSREAMAWTREEWRGDGTDTPAYELVIVLDGGGEEAAPIDASYLILDNTETCLRVLGTPDDDGVEGETEDGLDDGDEFEIRNLIGAAQKAYEKSRDYMIEITASPYPSTAWNGWFRKVVTAGGDSFPHLFSFWDEFVLAQITNEGSFEGNELIKLRHTNKDNPADTTHNFDTGSFSPYIDGSEDCGLIVHLGGADYDDRLTFDDGSIISATVLGYAPKTRLPIIVSNASGEYNNYYFGAALFDMASPAFGAAAVQSDGGAIAFIGSTDLVYSGITPSFTDGVLSQARLYNFDELLSYTVKAFHDAPKFIGDMFMGSQSSGGQIVKGPLIDFITNNGDSEGQLSFWANQKTIYQYTLLGDPALPIPYPQPDTIVTATLEPGLAFNENSLRALAKGRYESHDIGVDEIPDLDSASTTVNISARDGVPVGYRAPITEVKITRVDIRRDTGKEYTSVVSPSVPYAYTFATPYTEPGYYFVKVEQPGWNGNSSGSGVWGDWWEKEKWICVQEVNEFVPTAGGNILVIDDDFGYPIVTLTMFPNPWTYVYPSANGACGFEDWYLRTLDLIPGAGNYDVWHVDYDDEDSVFNTYHIPAAEGSGDDWANPDQGNLLMHGEIYQSILNSYDKVIWLTGRSDGYWRPSSGWGEMPAEPYPEKTDWLVETLTTSEQQCLMTYLNSGGRLLLSGQGITWDLEGQGLTEGPGGQPYFYFTTLDNVFLRDYLHLSAVYSSWGLPRLDNVYAVSNNPIGLTEDYPFVIKGIDGAENEYMWNDAEPDTAAQQVFNYKVGTGGGPTPEIGVEPFLGTAGTAHYRGRGASVFLPWGFESIKDQQNRNQVMTAILSWLDDPTRTGEGEDEGGDGDGDGDGDGGGVGSLGGCFIATACYDTPMSEEVRVLSLFRDEYLLTNSLGKFFVAGYYRFSPQIAEYISRRPLLKKFVRIGLKPLVSFSEILVEE